MLSFCHIFQIISLQKKKSLPDDEKIVLETYRSREDHYKSNKINLFASTWCLLNKYFHDEPQRYANMPSVVTEFIVGVYCYAGKRINYRVALLQWKPRSLLA
jgi:hypothetical protein